MSLFRTVLGVKCQSTILSVNVAQLSIKTTHGVEKVTNLNTATVDSKINKISQCSWLSRLLILASNSVQTSLKILQLPQPVDAVDHGMVKVECGVSR